MYSEYSNVVDSVADIAVDTSCPFDNRFDRQSWFNSLQKSVDTISINICNDKHQKSVDVYKYQHGVASPPEF